MGRNPVKATSLTWDNFNRFVSTLSRTYALRETVGKAYQMSFKDEVSITNESIIKEILGEQSIDFNSNVLMETLTIKDNTPKIQDTAKIKNRRVMSQPG